MTAEIVNLASFRASRPIDESAGLLRAKEPRKGGNVLKTMLTRHEQRWADQRDEPRHSTGGALNPAIWIGGKEARLENISKNGMMATTDLAVGPGSTVRISVPGCQARSGLVIWRREGLLGLEVEVGSMGGVAK